VSMKNLLPRSAMADTELGTRACGHIEPRPAGARIQIALRFRAVISNGEFRHVWQNGDAR
jgi:hypothetical protein